MPTKQQEIDTLKKFVASIDPNSYLGDFFQGCVPFFESAIRSDAVFAHADAIRSNEAQLRAVQAEIDAKTKKLREIEEKTTAMESRMLYAERPTQARIHLGQTAGKSAAGRFKASQTQWQRSGARP